MGQRGSGHCDRRDQDRARTLQASPPATETDFLVVATGRVDERERERERSWCGAPADDREKRRFRVLGERTDSGLPQISYSRQRPLSTDPTYAVVSYSY